MPKSIQHHDFKSRRHFRMFICYKNLAKIKKDFNRRAIKVLSYIQNSIKG